MSQVDDWAEADLAWKLVDAISPWLPASERAQLYAAGRVPEADGVVAAGSRHPLAIWAEHDPSDAV